MGTDEDKYYSYALAHRDLPNGKELFIQELTFGRARLSIGDKMSGYFDDEWDYDTPERAIAEMWAWDPDDNEPEGWMRHPKTGRRRPGGDKSKEYVRM